MVVAVPELSVQGLKKTTSKICWAPSTKPSLERPSQELGQCASLDNAQSTDYEMTELEPKETESLLSTLADVLEAEVAATERQLSANTASTSHQEDKLTPFHGTKCPLIPVKDYLRRIGRHSKCSPVCFVMAYIYTQRLAKVGEQYRLCSRSVHRLLITGVMIAAKLMDDKFFSNCYFARIGGVTTREINALELEMLQLLQYRAFVGRPQIQQQLRSMQVSLSVPEDAADARRSKKRVSEDVDSPRLEQFLPVKFQHDLHHSQVLVIPELAVVPHAVAAS